MTLGLQENGDDDFCHGTAINLRSACMAEMHDTEGVNRLWSVVGLEFGFQGFWIANGYGSTVDLQQALGLEAGKIPRNQFAHRAYLRGKLLVAGRQQDFDAFAGALASALRQPQEKRRQAVPNRGEGKFFDDANQPAEARSDHAQDFQGNLRMSQYQRLKILFAHKQQSRVIDGGDGCRIIAAIEDGKLSHRAARPLNPEYLLASTGGAFEDAHIPALDYVESAAGLAFAEHEFTGSVTTRNRVLRKEG